MEEAGAAGFLNIDLDMAKRPIRRCIWYAIRHFKQLQEIQMQLTLVQKQLSEVSRKLNRV